MPTRLPSLATARNTGFEDCMVERANLFAEEGSKVVASIRCISCSGLTVTIVSWEAQNAKVALHTNCQILEGQSQIDD